MQKEKRNNAVLKLTSSRRVGMRDINALLTAPISRISSRPQGRDDEGRSGFTLIELLVVVLIIGILAAIALPIYQKAIIKSQAMQGLVLLRSMVAAQESYYLEHGHYARAFDELALSLPADYTRTEKVIVSPDITDTRSNGEWSFQLLFEGSNSNMFVGRLQGPYAGVGFLYPFKTTLTPLQTKQIYCHERKSLGVTFKGKQGAFCMDILHGVLVFSSAGGPVFKL